MGVPFKAKNGLDANSNKIVNVANPTTAQDAATKIYVDNAVGTGLPSQTGNNGKFLTTNGTTASWSLVPVGGISATGTPSSTTYLRGDGTWATVTSSGGTVTSVGISGNNGIGVTNSPITSSGSISLTLGNITPTSISTGIGSFSGDVAFASSITTPIGSSSPVVIAPDGGGDLHINTDSIRFGYANSNSTLATRGTGDLILTTNEGSSTEGVIRLYDGANGNITITPNGTGNVGIGTVSPSAKLQVTGGDIYLSTAGSSIWLNGTTDSGDRLRLHQSTSNGYIDWGGGSLYFRSGASTSTNRMEISGSGVAVSGTLNATGAITQNGSQVLTASNLLNYAQSTTEWYHSNRDFVNGTLITTSIDYSVVYGDPFVLEIRGNSYGNLIPFSIQIQGYIYNNTIINYGGYSIGGAFDIKAMNVGGNLCFWFARQAYWQGFNVKAYIALPTRALNKVTSITDVVEPTAGTKKVTITPVQVLRSDNYSSYAIPVSGGINMSGSYGLNDQKLYLRGNGDNNHYLWNANDDWEELVAYAGTGFRVASSTGASLMTFTTSAVNSGVALQQGGNQVLHAGNANTYCPTRFTTTIDASALNQSTFYPVIMFPNNGRQLKVRVKNILNSNVPSWSTHPSGFTFVLDYEVNGHGWGTVVINRKIFNYSEGYTSARICGGIGQLGNGSAEYVMVRGGGIYYFEVDDSNCTPALYSSGYSYAGQSINPTTSTINDIWNSSAGTYLGVQAIYLPSYDGIYTQNNNGASFRPNDGTYGSWKIGGSRNGWSGIEFETTSNGTVSLMVQPNANTTGFYNNSAGWQFRWNVGTLYCHKGTYGGGTEATVLDSSNYSSYSVVAYGTSNDNIDADWGQSFKTFDPVPSGTPPISSPNIRTINIGNSYGRRTQLAFTYDTDRAFLRRRTDSSWSNWVEFLTTSNYSSYALPLSGGTITGSIYATSNNSGGEFYSYGWFRNYNSGTGIYNQATGNHFYSDGGYWNVAYGGTQGIRFRNGHAGAILGYLYAETNGNMGLLSNNGNWAVRVLPSDAGVYLYGTEVSVIQTLYVHEGANRTRVPRTFVQSSTPTGTLTNGDIWIQF